MEDKIMELITALATKLGTTAEHLWMVLMAQAKVSAWVDIGISLFGVAWIIVTLLTHNKLSEKDGDGYSYYANHDGYIGLMTILGIISVLFLLFTVFNLNSIVTGFVNPEYKAFREVIRLIR